jgi:NAD-dependent deacetylase
VKTEQLAALIRGAEEIVFFGGAGVSTESGIPDYRSHDGLYATRQAYGLAPEDLLSLHVFDQSPELFFRYYKENLVVTGAKPNAAHRALAELESTGKLRAVITQNVDGLHQAAGSQVVYELHGSNARHYCVNCSEAYSLAYILDPANCGADGVVPRCRDCGDIVRPDVVLYEEPLDGQVLAGAVAAIEAAQLLIVGGTSLAVYPAAGLLRHFMGSHLVIINKMPTPVDSSAQLVVEESIGAVLSEATRLALDASW